MRARNAIREFRAVYAPSAMPIRVHIAGGEYLTYSPITFEPQDSGWPGVPIQYLAWNPAGIGGVTSDDVLISGGFRMQGWTARTAPSGVSAYVAQVPAGISDIRDVWVNNQRMVRARFPNVPTCSAAYANPRTPPCPNSGYLVVTRVEAVLVGDQRRQRVVVRSADPNHPTDPLFPGPAIPQPADWSHVEASATRYWVNPQARVGFGFPVAGQPDQVRLEFPVTAFGTGNTEQDLGALGCFYYDNWRPEHNNPEPDRTYVRSYLQVVGEDDVSNPPQWLPARDSPAQLFLSNDLAFLDADKEWYFDAAHGELWLKTCVNPDSAGARVIVPINPKLLIVDHAQNLTFDGLSWAFTHQPFPTMVDGMTPGYASIQTGQIWYDASWPYWNNMVYAAITMTGAQSCSLVRCRIAHAGGSGVIIGAGVTFGPPAIFTESNNCRLSQCEVFDIGAHGVYIGDERSIDDLAWALPGQSGPGTDPSNGNSVELSKIQNYGVVYRDCVGVYAGHTRDLSITNNEISYGNYDGISVGTVQAHHLSVPIPTTLCGATIDRQVS